MLFFPTVFVGFAALWNFLTLHMQSLGLSKEEIGLINGIPSFLGIIPTFIAGTGPITFNQVKNTLQC